MAPRVDPVASDTTVPSRTSVVVIGGGIIGACTAFFLAQKGIATVLCEKGQIAGEQSSRNLGWCRKMGRDPREMPLIIESMRLWRTMNALVEAETGFRQAGIMYLSETRAQLESYEPWLEHARPFGLDSRIITAEEISRIMPAASRSWAGALYTASDGRAEPQMAAPAVAEAARRHGAAILTSCAVRGIETQGGRVSAAVTEKGRIACDSIVLAGGVWSRLFCGNLGIEFPQMKALASHMRTEKVDGGPDCSAMTSGFGLRKRLDGGYTMARINASIVDIVPDSFRLFRDYLPASRIRWKSLKLRLGRRFLEEWRVPRRWTLDVVSPFEKVRVLDPEPSERILNEAIAEAETTFPAFKNLKIAERWGGLIDVTPDIMPVISPVEATPGFFIASGFSGHGFGIGPGAGKLMADLVAGDRPAVDPTPFRLSRYTDGSRPLPSTVAT